jgi:hypothetical protein
MFINSTAAPNANYRQEARETHLIRHFLFVTARTKANDPELTVKGNVYITKWKRNLNFSNPCTSMAVLKQI